MTAIDPSQLSSARQSRRFARITRADGWLRILGLPWITPLLAIAAFIAFRAALAPTVQTSRGAIPEPAQVWEQAQVLHQSALDEDMKQAEFLARQTKKNAALVAEGKADQPGCSAQIGTSIITFFTSFLFATAVAVPLGIVMGISATTNAAINPLVQIFKPDSPLVSAVATGGDDGISKSFLVSTITVTLCSLWPTLINTAFGVASIDKDLVSVGRILKLSP